MYNFKNVKGIDPDSCTVEVAPSSVLRPSASALQYLVPRWSLATEAPPSFALPPE